MIRLTRRVGAAASVPWNAFVAAFLYYTLLAVLSLGGVSPSPFTVIAAYLMPPLVYLAALSARALRAVAGWISGFAAPQAVAAPR